MVKTVELQEFLGDWQVERHITHANQPPAHFIGTAQWRACKSGAVQSETGTLHISGHPPMQTARSYVWHEDLSVHFEDGRYFHAVPPQGGAARHWCAPDDYRVVYRFEKWPEFETVWRVVGPHKDYTMVSRYQRS